MKQSRKNRYAFEVHTYAPELNKILLNGINVNKHFPESIRRALTKDYAANLQTVRKHITFQPFHHYITIEYYGEKSGFSKNIQGGFNSWKEVMPVFHQMKNWFVGEEPKRAVKFLY